MLCIISVCNHILFENTVSKSNCILALLDLRIHMLTHHFTLSFLKVYLQHSFHCLKDETDKLNQHSSSVQLLKRCDFLN